MAKYPLPPHGQKPKPWSQIGKFFGPFSCFSASFQACCFSLGKKIVLVFGFSFGPKEGVWVLLPLLPPPPQAQNEEKLHKISRQSSKLTLFSGPEKGVITKGVFSLERSLESLKSLNSLESLQRMVGFSFVFHSVAVL